MLRVLGAFAKLRKTSISFVTSALMEQQPGCPWTDFHNIWVLFENLCRKFKFCCKVTRITTTYMKISRRCHWNFSLT